MNTFVVVVLVLLAILSIVFFTRSKISGLTLFLLKILFPFCLILVISTLFFSKPFNKLSEFSMEKSGVLGVIREMDEDLDKLNPADEIAEFSKGLTSGVIDFFSGNNKEDEAEEVIQSVDQEKVRILEERLYPKLVVSVSFFYRFLFFVLGILGLVFSIYLSYVMEGVSESKKLKAEFGKKIKKLEKEISSLKKQK